jgi:RNA polymerase sigma factor (sigma-70 family)
LESAAWPELAGRIEGQDPDAMAELYQLLLKMTRPYLLRQLGPQEQEDKLHDVFVGVVQTIQRGGLRDSRALVPFVIGVARRQVAMQISSWARRRSKETEPRLLFLLPARGPSPEQWSAARQRLRLVDELLAELSARDHQILWRFYRKEHPWERICEDMGLTSTQFRLFKSRALRRLGKLLKERLAAAKQTTLT